MTPEPSKQQQLRDHFRSKWFWGSIIVIAIFLIVMASLRVHLQVGLFVLLYNIRALVLTCPLASAAAR